MRSMTIEIVDKQNLVFRMDNVEYQFVKTFLAAAHEIQKPVN